MSFLMSPTFMVLLNAAGTVFGALESSGVINMLGSKWGGVAVIVATAVNGVAHALSPPVAGPLAAK